MKEYLPELNLFDKILKNLFTRYTEKIYRKGIQDGFNWREKTNNNHNNSKGCNKAVIHKKKK